MMKKISILLLAFILASTALMSQGQLQLISLDYKNLKAQQNTDSIFPPLGLTAQVQESDVLLSWLPPDIGPGEWIGYTDGTISTAIGVTDYADWQVAIKWDQGDLEMYDGEYLRKVEFVPFSTNASFKLQIREGENGENVVYEQSISDPDSLEWNEIVLNEPYQIDATQSLYVGFEISQGPDDWPMGCDAGPSFPGYSDLVFYNTGQWENLGTFGLYVNWSIRAFVSLAPGSGQSRELSQNRNLNTDPTGYYVYRDDLRLTEVPLENTSFTDSGVQSGIYTYNVTSIYDTIESEPASIQVQVGGPMLQLSEDSIFIALEGESAIDQELMLYNTGDDLLEWSMDISDPWVYADVFSGQIEPGDSALVILTYEAYSLLAGTYTTEIVFSVNNLSFPEVSLFNEMQVSGVPALTLSLQNADFGEVYLNTSGILEMSISNTGNDLLVVSDMESSDSRFSVSVNTFELIPGESVAINLIFSPDSVGELNGVLSIYSNNPVPVTNIDLFGSGILRPPGNLQASSDQEIVSLTWVDPDGGPGTWLYYGDGINVSAIGLGDAGTWQLAARWDTSQLASFSGEYLTKVRFYTYTGGVAYTLKIWDYNNDFPVILYEQNIPVFDTNSWNEVFLEEPLYIDGETNILVGLEMDQDYDAFPAGCDLGPGVAGYSDLVSLDGISWLSLSDYGLDYNWSLQAFITGEEGFVPIISSNRNTNAKVDKDVFKMTAALSEKRNLTTDSLTFLGYNVYRNDEKINSELLTDNFYTDTLLLAGTYTYGVTAVYNMGESAQAGPVTVVIDSLIFLMPQGWIYVESMVEHHIMIPSEIADHPDNYLLRDDWVGVFFAHDQQMVLAGMTHWDGTGLELTAYGDHFLTPEKDGFLPGDSLVFMIYRPENEMTYLARAVYNPAMPDHDGLFNEDGLSELQALSINALVINDDTFFKDVSFFPVPVVNNLHIANLPENTVIKLYNSSGKEMYTDSNTGSQRILDLSSINSGLYIVVLVQGTHITSKKILVQ